MDTNNTVSQCTRQKRAREALSEHKQELAALILLGHDETKVSKQLRAHITAYKRVCKKIVTDLAKYDVDVSASLPLLARKSAALSVTHDAMAGTLLLELVLCKRELEAVRSAASDAGDDADTDNVFNKAKQATNKARTEAEDRLLKRLFAIMEQLRKANKGFFDILPTLEAMGVSRSDQERENMGPPHPSEKDISVSKNVRGGVVGGSVVIDSELPFGDAEALAEYRRMLKSRDAWAARQEKLLEK